MKNIIITGGNGQLARTIKNIVNELEFEETNFRFFDKIELDILRQESIMHHINSSTYLIINCAAYTDVESCETPDGAHMADNINYIGVRNLVKVCEEFDIPLLHISSNYVFDGLSDRAYEAYDYRMPVNYYGVTKKLAENIVLDYEKGFILRTSYLYSLYGVNIFKKIYDKISRDKDIKLIDDCIVTSCYADDLADVIIDMSIKMLNPIKITDYYDEKIWQYSNSGGHSWYDFGLEMKEIMNSKSTIKKIVAEDLDLKAKRPVNGMLNSSAIEEELNKFPTYWKESLRECVKKYEDV